MSKEMIISPSPHETKVALLEDGQVVEIYVEREKEIGLAGSVYKGRVTRVLPGMQSAFVDIGLERDAFLYVSDFFEGLEEYEQITAPEALPAQAEVLEADEEPPAAEEAEERQPPEPAPPAEPEDEDRQPAYLMQEPPLQLPERRPGRRGRPHGRRPRRRGGRGRRPPRDRRPEPARAFRPEPSPAPQVSGEPIILPGESLAKYRNRLTAPQPVETEVPEPTRPESTRESEETRSEIAVAQEGKMQPSPPESPAAAPELAPQAAEPEPPAAETPEAAEPGVPPPPEPEAPATSAEEKLAEEAPEVGVSAAPEETVSETTEEAAPETAPQAEGQPAEVSPTPPPAEGYPDAMTLAEIQRVRQYEDQVGLPPSVQERVAGGVEWDRNRGAERGREPRPGQQGRQGRRGRGGRRHGRRRRGGREREPRGREPRRRRGVPARPSRGQPAIAEMLRPGQEIIVQIAKEQMGKKGARITSHVTLPGRFLVFMPTIEHIGISRRIGTSEERSRLRRVLLDLKGNISGGFVVRTAAAGCSEEDLRQDIDYLIKLWHEIRVRADETPAPVLLHRDLSLVQRLVRDQFTPDYTAVWIDSEEEYAKVVDFVAQLQPDLARRVKLFTKPTPIFEEMGVQQEIDRALRPKVWLKSGGYIVINQTEALVAVDVNTGKYVGKGSTRLEDTIVKTNLEALEEIVRQIRLRDLGGIIIIDFIDMEVPRNRHRVMRALEDALRRDRSPSKLLSFNEFGLVAITRKRSRQSLERVLCQPCPTCTGTGMVKSIETLSFEIQKEARKMAENIDAPELTIRAHPEIVRSLKGRENTIVRELEESTGKNIILQPDNNLHIEEYNIY